MALPFKNIVIKSLKSIDKSYVSDIISARDQDTEDR